MKKIQKSKEIPILVNFVNTTLEILSVRENPELFGKMNQIYNLVLKQVYIMALAHKYRVYEHAISHIRNVTGGRIDALQ